MSHDQMNEFRQRITRLETVVGEDASSGIRGEVNEAKGKIDRIFDRISSSEKRMAMIVGGIMVAGRFLEVFLK